MDKDVLESTDVGILEGPPYGVPFENTANLFDSEILLSKIQERNPFVKWVNSPVFYEMDPYLGVPIKVVVKSVFFPIGFTFNSMEELVENIDDQLYNRIADSLVEKDGGISHLYLAKLLATRPGYVVNPRNFEYEKAEAPGRGSIHVRGFFIGDIKI